ncbi:MAG: hypothetical protein L3K03_06835 [Thermoplasmata archaeon]|nr:hypothetical protein [Thermoplasmata archaeon]
MTKLAMPDSCIICESSLGPDPNHCPTCGYPTALTGATVVALGPEGYAALSDEDVPILAPEPSTPGVVEPARLVDPVFDLRGTELLRSVEALRTLGGNPAELLAPVRRLILLHAEGQSVTARQALEEIAVHAAADAGRSYSDRLGQFDIRLGTLREQGVDIAVPVTPFPRFEEYLNGSAKDTLRLVREEERRLSEMERSWNELRSTIGPMRTLAEMCRAAERPTPLLDQAIHELTEALRAPPIPTARVGELATRAIRALHESGSILGPVLEAELERSLADLPEAEARAAQAEVGKLLKKRRWVDGLRRLDEWRAGTASPTPDRSAPEAPSARMQEVLVRLRDTTARVRALPVDDPLTEEAAGVIRAVSELVRQSKLEEADRLLQGVGAALDKESRA